MERTRCVTIAERTNAGRARLRPPTPSFAGLTPGFGRLRPCREERHPTPPTGGASPSRDHVGPFHGLPWNVTHVASLLLSSGGASLRALRPPQEGRQALTARATPTHSSRPETANPRAAPPSRVAQDCAERNPTSPHSSRRSATGDPRSHAARWASRQAPAIRAWLDFATGIPISSMGDRRTAPALRRDECDRA